MLLQEYSAVLSDIEKSAGEAELSIVFGTALSHPAVNESDVEQEEIISPGDIDGLWYRMSEDDPRLTKEQFIYAVENAGGDAFSPTTLSGDPPTTELDNYLAAIEAGQDRLEEIAQRGLAATVIPPLGMTAEQWVIHTFDLAARVRQAVYDAYVALTLENSQARATEGIRLAADSVRDVIQHLRKQILAKGMQNPFSDGEITGPDASEPTIHSEPTVTANDAPVRTADGKSDNRGDFPALLPESQAVRDLCRKLQKELPLGRSQIAIARESTGEREGNARKAQSLLRQARRYPHLWKGRGRGARKVDNQ